MARNALRADDVSWLLRTVKIQQCVAFGCSNRTKNRKDTSTNFHVFPKDNRLRRAWIQAVERTSLPKVPVCVWSISMLIASNTRWEWAAWIVPLEAKTLTWGYSHDLSTQTSPICTCCNLRFHIHFRSFLTLRLCSHILRSYKPLVVVSSRCVYY